MLLNVLPTSLLYAKEGTVKYGKFLIYVGEKDKQGPYGRGELYLLNPQNKKDILCTISGDFTHSAVNNAILKSNFFNNFSVNSLTLKYHDEKKCQSFDIIIPSSSIIKSDIYTKKGGVSKSVSEICAEHFIITFTQTDESWEYKLQNKAMVSKNEELFYKRSQENNLFDYNSLFLATISDPSVKIETLDKLGYNYNVKGLFDIGKNDISLEQLVIPLYNDLIYNNDTFFDLKHNTSYVVKSDGSTGKWFGERFLSDGTKISKKGIDSEHMEISFADGGRFSGKLRITDDLALVHANASVNKADFLDGEYSKDGKTEKWINGEELSILHERLIKIYDEDLVSSIENGNLTESQAKEQQDARNAKKAEEESIALMQKLWNCTEIVFGGRFKGTADGDRSLRALWGIDHTYFDGEVLLALNTKGECVFVVLSGPSKKAISEGRGRALQINSLCSGIFNTEVKNGRWTLEGNKILVKGLKDKWTLTLNKGGQTIECDMGLFTSTLKIIKKN